MDNASEIRNKSAYSLEKDLGLHTKKTQSCYNTVFKFEIVFFPEKKVFESCVRNTYL